jgi:hypothetical protein
MLRRRLLVSSSQASDGRRRSHSFITTFSQMHFVVPSAPSVDRERRGIEMLIAASSIQALKGSMEPILTTLYQDAF